MQVEINFNQSIQQQNTIGFDQAKEIKEIADIQREYNKLKEQTRYLQGNKKGAWGSTTTADEKRSFKLSQIKDTLTYKKRKYDLKYPAF